MTTASPDRQDLRRRLLAATLPHVPFEGWTRASIDAGESFLPYMFGKVDDLELLASQVPGNSSAGTSSP